MKFQTLFTLAALGSGTLAFPAVPSYASEDGTDAVSSYAKPTKVRHHPTGIFMSGVYPTGDFPTGHPKHTGAHGTGHHKSVSPTDAPILPRHRPHPTGGYPGAPGSIPPMPSMDPNFSSFQSDHFSGPHPTGPFTMDPFPTGGPASKRDVSAPYPSDVSSDVQTSDAAFTGKGPHKTGGHGTGAHPEPTGVMPTGAGRPEGYPKYSKQY